MNRRRRIYPETLFKNKSPRKIMEKNGTKFLDEKEFQDRGYLQEVNRRFFHPLGLAMTVSKNQKNGKVTYVGIQDWRDDPEGGFFANLSDNDSKNKYKEIMLEAFKFRQKRLIILKKCYDPAILSPFIVQPIGHNFSEKELKKRI